MAMQNRQDVCRALMPGSKRPRSVFQVIGCISAFDPNSYTKNMKRQFLGSTLLAGAVAITSSLYATPAKALSFGFSNIAGGDTVGDAFAGKFKLDVTGDASTVRFAVSNLFDFGTGNQAGKGAFVRQVYFDGQVGLLSSLVPNDVNTSRNGVSFSSAFSGPPDLPQGNNIGFTSNFKVGAVETGSGSSRVGVNENAVQGEEVLGVKFASNLSAVVAAINSGKLRVGLHVQNLPGSGKSDAYVTAPIGGGTPVPTPAVIPGLIGMGVAAMRKKKHSDTGALEG